MVDVFRDNTKSVPMQDRQIVRVPMDQLDIGGRKDNLPTGGKSEDLSIRHVPNADSK